MPKKRKRKKKKRTPQEEKEADAQWLRRNVNRAVVRNVLAALEDCKKEQK